MRVELHYLQVSALIAFGPTIVENKPFAYELVLQCQLLDMDDRVVHRDCSNASGRNLHSGGSTEGKSFYILTELIPSELTCFRWAQNEVYIVLAGSIMSTLITIVFFRVMYVLSIG